MNITSKILLSIITGTCLVSFTACGSSDSSSGSKISAENSSQQKEVAEMSDNKLKISVNGTELTATLENNSSAEALTELLKQGDITIDMSDYGNFEKVGNLPQSLPKNDEKITTVPGDIILYQGNKITIYYAENTWDFTKLGHINNITQEELKTLLGDGDVTVSLSIS